jgi:hypothetical protein
MYEGYCKTDKPEAEDARPEPLEVSGVAAAGAGAPNAPSAARAESRGWRALAWPLFLLVSTGAAWGATFSLARIATTAGAHPIGLTLWQGVFGGALLVGLALSPPPPAPTRSASPSGRACSAGRCWSASRSSDGARRRSPGAIWASI